MTTTLDLPANPMCESVVCYRTSTVSYVNAENEEVRSKRRAWSTPPNGRCRSHTTNELIAVEYVAGMTHVLPRTDQRVLSASDTRIIQDNSKPRVVVMWLNGGARSQRIVTTLRDTPLGIALHPQHEYMAVASNTHGAYLMALR